MAMDVTALEGATQSEAVYQSILIHNKLSVKACFQYQARA
jgi:hypothetical protein